MPDTTKAASTAKVQERTSLGYKTYEGERIRVFWNPEVCEHAAKCARGNAAVFNPRRRPWVDLTQAPAKEIAQIIDRCPSRALQYELKEQQVDIVFEEKGPRSVAYVASEAIGKCEVSVCGALWLITHTEVSPAYGGQGIARRLVDAVVEEARKRHVRIDPLCPYAKRLMEGSDAYRDVL